MQFFKLTVQNLLYKAQKHVFANKFKFNLEPFCNFGLWLWFWTAEFWTDLGYGTNYFEKLEQKLPLYRSVKIVCVNLKPENAEAVNY